MEVAKYFRDHFLMTSSWLFVIQEYLFPFIYYSSYKKQVSITGCAQHHITVLPVEYDTRSECSHTTSDHGGLAVWLSGNALALINVVALRQTRLVLGWVTVCGRVNHFGV